MRVAWLGTGLLGRPMAERLLLGGFDVVAWNRTREKAIPLQATGAVVAATPHEAIEAADCVVLMLTDANAIDQVLDQHGSLPNLGGRTVIQMGTISSAESLQLYADVIAAGGDYFEAPVLGSIPQASAGQLIVMVGGSAEQLQRWRNLLCCLGAEPLLIGPVGHASTLKLALNQLIASLTTAFSFSLGMVRRRGIDHETFMKILRQSALHASTFDKKLPRMLERQFDQPNFPSKHLLKDVELIEREADQLGLETVSIGALSRVLQRTMALGHAESDYSSLYDAVDPG